MLAAVSTTAVLVPAPAGAQDVLPDLDQQVPTDLSVKRVRVGGRRLFRLGFASASADVGAGPLSLFGRRRARTSPTMTVNQLGSQADPDALLCAATARCSGSSANSVCNGTAPPT
jgi:hypothetical protein